MDKEIRISLSIFWDIALQGGNEVMRYLSNSFIYGNFEYAGTIDNLLKIYRGTIIELSTQRMPRLT